MVRKAVGVALEGLAIVLVVALVAGQLLGQPILLSYVTTDSMAPTIDPGDGFVAIPAELSGDIEEGDVITFRAETLNGGGLTTHRVAEVTDRGFVTKGDNNPFTDQDDEEPPVKPAQVVAVAWQPGGTVLSIPFVGTAVTGVQNTLSTVQRSLAAALGTRSLLGVQGLAYLLFALSVIAYAVDLYLNGGESRERGRDRGREDGTSTRLLVAGFALLIVVGATAAMVVPAGAQQFGIVSAESDAPGPRVIETGTSESVQYPVGNGGLLPVIVYLEPGTDGVAVEPGEFAVPSRAAVNATLTLSAPPETGYYRQYLVQHRYLAVLPQSTIAALHGIHPWLPLVVIDLLLGGGFYAVGMALVGTGRLRSRRRERPGGSIDWPW
jgi:signal peptidase